ncbi:transposase [Sinorhizobium meliloti]|nr:transposase [Sinorhizobium meliloti]
MQPEHRHVDEIAGVSASSKEINICTVLAGQKLGIKAVDRACPGLDPGYWLVSFMHDDLGYIDLEQRTWQTIDNPFGTRLSPMS